MIPFNYHHFYYFYTIATSGSMSTAAKELHLTQSGLSIQIKQLEASLGVKLFERKGKKLVLTEEGRSAFNYAKAVFDAGQEFLDHVRDRSSTGRLLIQIGVSNSIPKAFASALLKFIRNLSPDVHIQLREDTLPVMIQSLKDHGLDLILSDTPFQTSTEDGIRNHLIGKIPVVFCAHPRIAARHKNIPKSLDHAPMILPTSQSQVFHSVQEYFVTHGVTPKIIAEIQDVELIHRMVLQGAGIAPLNRYSVLNSPFRGRLILLGKNKQPDIHDTSYIITKDRKIPHPLTERIVKEFRLADQ